MKGPATSRVRYGVAGMLFVTVAINYLDRGNLAVAATDLSRDLRLDPVRLGLIFSGFGWAYAFFQIPGGWLVDRVGPRKLYALACGLWSVATLMQGFAGAFFALLGLRLLLGLFEAPSFPICNKLATEWFPDAERAGAIGFYTSGQFIGLGLLTPLLVMAQSHFGWRSVFIITGGVGLAWSAVWYARYRDPDENTRLSAAEREHIRAGGGWANKPGTAAGPVRFNFSDLRFVLSQRKLWGIYLGQFALNAVPWFFLTWFPTYLVQYRHFDLAHTGYSSALPYLVAVAGVLAGGVCSDLLVRRGASASFARKSPIIVGMLLSTSVIGANFVTDPQWVVFFFTFAFFCNGFASITWILVSLLAPKRLIGLTGGVFNFFGNLASAVVPLVIGVIVKHGGFAPALGFIAAVALGGVVSYLSLVGKVERIPSSLVIVIMGVAGSGKTTVGRKLAEDLGWPFHDADEFHPPENIAKMTAGIPLDDDDRAPWLAAIRSRIDGYIARDEGAVFTCSALREAYRRVIVSDPARVPLVYLHGSPELIRERISQRKGHFMKEGMINSQFEALEPPADAIAIDIAGSPDEIVSQIRADLRV
jgi:ACS family D-galactonate transporter-like MFS transporter